MRRIVVWVLSILVIGLTPCFVLAQGFIGAGLPALPSLGGFMGSSGSFGDKVTGIAVPTLYVGYGAGDLQFGAGADNLGAAGVRQINHSYRNNGVWLGAALPVGLSEYFSVLASGWYFFPTSDNGTTESYNQGRLGQRHWSARTQWWYVDGLVAISCGKSGAALLAGVRYDSFTTKFQDPSTERNRFDLATDEADVISEGWIPLLGVQYAMNSGQNALIARFVGIPTLLGTAKYNETINNNRIESSGNWNGGYFWELFAEYDRNFNQMGGIGVFGRVQSTNGRADLDLAYIPTPDNDTFRLGLNRLNWTVGGSMNLSFNLPL
jgi:hypothetical protein